MGATLHMRMLGGFALEQQGAPLATITSPRLQALLAYLALHGRQPQPRQRLAAALWPDSSEPQAHTNLRTLLHRLHAALPDADRVLCIDAQSIAWHPAAALTLDVAEFEAALVRAGQAGDDDAACAALEQAALCYAGDLLPDCYDEWVLPERERLQQRLLEALERLAALLERRRDYAAAITHTRRLLRLDPLNEAAYLSLMRLRAVCGDRAGALRAYHTCATVLASEVGGAPGGAIRAAYERLLAAEASPLVDASPAVPLVGRAHEWAQMQAAWQSALAGSPRLLVLSGEAGIGKTRLADELLRWAGRQGVAVAVAHCYAAEGDLAYAPAIAWLRCDALRPALARLDPAWLSEVARLAPELLPARPDVPRSRPLTQPWQRQRLFDALARAFHAVGRPLLLLIDDLQWCDQDTLEWLHFLLRSGPPERLLIVGTVRVEEPAAARSLAELLDALRHESRASEIGLGPLSPEQTAELAALIVGRALSREQAADMFAETEGNPLFVVETVRAGFGAAAQAAPAQPQLPPGVHTVIARRLQQVTPAARELLRVAAVIGRSFVFGVLARAADATEDDLVRGLDELWQRRIVREHGLDAYDFTHDKLRAVAYESLSTARRRVLHRRVADAIVAEHGASLDAVSAQIASHYERAGMPGPAISYYRRAAESAARLYANAESIGYYRRALALLGGKATAETAGLCDRLGDLLHLVGRYDEARAAWQSALDAAPAHDRLARAHLQRKIGNAWRDQYSYAAALRAYQDAEAALAEAPDQADGSIALCLAEIELERITTHYWLGQAAEMLRLIDRVQPIVERRGSAEQRAHLHQSSCLALLRQDRYRASPEAVAHARAYLAALEDARVADGLPAARFLLGFALLWAEDLAGAEQQIGTALTLAERSGDISLEGRCATYLTVIARRRGQADLVQPWAERSLRVATAGRLLDYIGAAQGSLAWLAVRAGDLAAAGAHGRKALDAWQPLPAGYMFEWIARWPLIGVALVEEDVARASAHARALLDNRQQRPPATLEPALESAVRAAEAGRIAEAGARLADARALARELGFL